MRGGALRCGGARGASGPPLGAVSLIEAQARRRRVYRRSRRCRATSTDALAFRRALTGALVYPAILLATSIGAILFLLAFVLPQFQAAFAEAGAKLPVSTEILLAIGRGLIAWGPYGLAALALALGALARWRATPAGRRETDTMLLRIPFVAGALTRLDVARFARNVGSLLAARVTLVRALRLAESGATNTVIAARLRSAGERVTQGERLAAALSAAGPWPADAIELIHIGEEAGRLDTMLLHLADLYEGELKRKTERALTLLTPALTLAMAGIVAAIIGSVLSAILGAYDLPM
ncbi:MAG: type II secretion system F family protein [Alphaproteobacteria bacterium]